MKRVHIQLVNMQNVIGDLAIDYGIPCLEFDDLVTLGKHAVRVYNLETQASRIPFADLCEYIRAFIQTPFGLNFLKKLSEKVDPK